MNHTSKTIDENETILRFYKSLNHCNDLKELIFSFFDILQSSYSPDRLLILKYIDDTEQMTVTHESPISETSLLSIRINEIYSILKNNTSQFLTLNNLQNTLFESYKINSLALFPLDKNQTFLALCYETASVPLPKDKINLISSLCQDFQISLIKTTEHEKKNEELSRLKLQNELLREQEKFRTDFLNNISHELKTPLSSILGFSKILLTKKNISESPDVIINHLHESSLRLVGLVNDLNQATKPVNGWVINKSLIKINEIIESSIKEFSILNKDFKIFYEYDSSIPEVKTDPKLLRQLIDNLISNAIKYSVDKKEIEICLKNINNKILISVLDNGVGISSDETSKLFDRYFRSSNPQIKDISGSGLGLAISKEISQALGGEISVSSKIGTGSTFTISLPKT